MLPISSPRDMVSTNASGSLMKNFCTVSAVFIDCPVDIFFAIFFICSFMKKLGHVLLADSIDITSGFPDLISSKSVFVNMRILLLITISLTTGI